MSKFHLKSGDTVMVITGKDKGKKGKVLSVDAASRKVIVEGVNMATKHVKPRKQGDQSGIISQEAGIYACKVMHICPSCGKATRIGYKILDDGSKVRVCKKCSDVFEK